MLNQCLLSGNLGQDPETRFYSEDQQLTSFNLAFRVNKNRTGWVRVICFGRLAEVAAEYLHKGAKVVVLGSLDQQKWETEDGQTRNGFQVVAHSLEFVKTDEKPVEDPPF